MQVMEELQGAKEEEPAPEETAMVAAGLEGAGPSLDIDEELRILEDEAQVSIRSIHSPKKWQCVATIGQNTFLQGLFPAANSCIPHTSV